MKKNKKDTGNQFSTLNKPTVICPWCYKEAYKSGNVTNELARVGDEGKDLICPHCKKEFRAYGNYDLVFNTNRLIQRGKKDPREAWVWGEQPKDE